MSVNGRNRLREARRKLRFAPAGARDGKPWSIIQTKHYLVCFDEVARAMAEPTVFAAALERRLSRIAACLGLKKDSGTGRYPFRRIVPYFVHDPAVHNYGSVDFQGVDVYAGGTHEFYMHEETHVVLAECVGVPPPLFDEGLACHVAERHSRQDDRVALSLMRNGLLPRLTRMAHSDGFLDIYTIYRAVAYRIAHSFIRWLCGRFGMPPLLALARRVPSSAKQARVLRDFRAAYCISLAGADRAWRDHLSARARHLAISPCRMIGPLTEPEYARSHIDLIRKALSTGRV